MPEDEDDVTHVMLAADADTTVVYEYRRESGGGGGGGASLPVTESASGGESPPVEVDGGGGGGSSSPPAPEPTASGMKSKVSLPFSGGNGPTFVSLTNSVTTSAGVGHPTNTGQASIGLVALGPNGEVLSVLNLDPGQSAEWFNAPAGATSIAVANREADNPLDGELTYDAAIY